MECIPSKNILSRSVGVFSALAVLLFAGCSSNASLATVGEVDINRYAGRWFEVVRLPQFFERDCACVTASYEKAPDFIRVVNTCLDTVSNKQRTSKGKAFVAEGSNNSRLKVQFFFPFRGDYFIIDLDSNYQWAMVGAPSRESLWILSRSPILADTTLTQLLDKASALGFDVSQVEYTDQSQMCNHSTRYP